MIVVGDKWDRITVLKFSGRDAHHRKLWLIACDCGSQEPWIAREDGLKNGRTKSCGCLRKEKFVRGNTSHGMTSRTHVPPAYQSWSGIIQRCTNAKSLAFAHYGARGISVCERWRSFENFYADMGDRPDGMEIERDNNEGNYEPGNCRWATRFEQMQNTRLTRKVTIRGQILSTSEAAKLLGVKRNAIYGRVRDHHVTHQQAVDHFASIAGPQ